MEFVKVLLVLQYVSPPLSFMWYLKRYHVALQYLAHMPQGCKARAWCKSGTRTSGPGIRDPPQSLKGGPRTPLKFKSGTPAAFFNEFIFFFQNVSLFFYLCVFFK